MLTLGLAGGAKGESAKVSWSANPESDIAGYTVHLGRTSGSYTSSFDAGNTTSLNLSALSPATTYYCAVQAYNTYGLASDLSAEVAFNTSQAATPEIAIQAPGQPDLVNGTAFMSMGAVSVGTSGPAQTLTIVNQGGAALSGIEVILYGANPDDFSVSTTAGSLAAGASSTLQVTFAPGATGSRNAILAIISNDADESTFEIALSGTGTALPTPDMRITSATGSELTSGTSGLNFGSSTLGSAATVQSLTIANQGGAILSGLGVSISGANAGDFTVTNPGTSIAEGSSAVINVSFTPGSTGPRAATLTITSNDPDENPFIIALSGTGTLAPEPEIAILKTDGAELINGSASISFGSLNLGAAGAPQTFTIKNQGTAQLSGLSMSVGGSHAADFLVSTLSNTSIGAGISTTFTITFKPTAAGLRNAVLHIASNDADENPFDITLSGVSVTQPEIAITQANGIELENGISAYSLGSVTLGASGNPLAFTIRNTGAAGLTDLALTIDGSAAADFIVSPLPNNSLGAGYTTSFSVIFKPSAAGTRSAVLHIASNDADENPFDIALSGIGLTAPEIEVAKADGTSLTDGASGLGFGSIELGATGNFQVLTIANSGSAGLTGLGFTVDGPGAADFVISSFSANTIGVGGSTSFSIGFLPKTAGLRSAVLHISNNDADENPFDITLTGTGVAVPKMEVLDFDGNPMTSGKSLSLGTIDVGMSTDAKELVILSTGTANLTGISAQVTGLHAADFAISAISNSVLAPGGGTSLLITFTPAASGLRTATLAITGNDPARGTLWVPLTGTAAAHPRISVVHPDGFSLTNGASALEFGEVDLRESSDEMICTLANTGTADLTNLAISSTGNHAADFEITSPPKSLLKAGESTTFSVRFIPGAIGTRGGWLQIDSNDSNRGRINIPLSGTGVGRPELEIALNGQALAPVRISPIDFGSAHTGATGASKTFTLRNTGTAPLSGIKVLRSGSNSGDFTISPLSATSLKPGASLSFKVVFTASGTGRRDAMLTISGADENISTSRIPLTAISVAVPILDMKVAGGGDITDKHAYISFSNRDSKTLVITNRGNAPLTQLKLSASGVHVADFDVAKLKSTTLAPGKSASVKIRFVSGGKGNRWAALKVTGNDPNTPVFEISLIGKGSSTAKSAMVAKSDQIPNTLTHETSSPAPIRSVVTIDGLKYRCLTIPKPLGRRLDPKNVEVSSDLVDWNSGHRFTTVIKDNERFLKVRDNTPLAPGEKRHIRYQRN